MNPNEIELDDEWQADRDLSQRLGRAWPAFFDRFGRLTSVQRAVAGPILDGENLLVCAPTAAGKTEAACAPLVERYAREKEPWTVLYVSPTRALVNDLHERLSHPLGALGLHLARRTGDHHDDYEKLPHVLLTTPESFDSLLCRGRRQDVGHVLVQVTAVVLDEIHLLHGTARGEQTRWLLERLRRLKNHGTEQGWCTDADLQIIALSATIPSPEQVLSGYLPSPHRQIFVPGARAIELIATPERTRSVEEAVSGYIQDRTSPEKILVFSNSRKRVDELASSLRVSLDPTGYAVRAHHGSLSQSERESAERAAKFERRIVLVATSTLEIGVDIGDIDLVVLDGPPPDVSAFLQRIGRGNRRTMKTRVMLCASCSRDELIHAAMHQAAGQPLDAAEGGAHYAVARQQLGSYIAQAPIPYRSEESLKSLLSACIPEVSATALIDHLVLTRDLIRDNGRVRLGDELLEAFASGQIHSNIERRIGYTVTDQSSGDEIAVGVRYAGGGRRLSIGGKEYHVSKIGERGLEVRRANGNARADAQYSYATGPFVNAASQPQSVRKYLELGEREWPVLRLPEQTLIFHFGGTRRKAVLELLARRSDVLADVSVTDWYLRLPNGTSVKPAWMVDVDAGTLDLLLSHQLESMERLLARPKANRHLPLDLRLAEVRRWLTLSEQLRTIQESIWIEPNPHVAQRLLTLHQT